MICLERMFQLRKQNVKIKDFENRNQMNTVKSQLPPERMRLFELSTKKGSSTWLTALPIREF